MDQVQKVAQITKASGDRPRTYAFVASDESVDRYGDIVKFEGWDFKNYKLNPIALYQHSSTIPIGVTKIIPDAKTKTINAEITLADEGTSELIDSIAKLLDQRILRAVSVGFLPTKPPLYREDPKTGEILGYIFNSQELTELSVVSVPANPNAIAYAKSLGIKDRQIERLFLPADTSALAEQAVRARYLEVVRLGATGLTR